MSRSVARALLLALSFTAIACWPSGPSEKAPTQGVAGDGPASPAKNGGQAVFHNDGKEYILSMGGPGAGLKTSLAISIPEIPGAKVEGGVRGANETSVSIVAPMPLGEFMDIFLKDFSAKGYTRKSMIIGDGLATATWSSADGSIEARIYVIGENQRVTARLVVIPSGV